MTLTEDLKALVYKCPLGWYKGKVIRTRATTDADVIMWLHELQELTDKLVEANGTAESDVAS